MEVLAGPSASSIHVSTSSSTMTSSLSDPRLTMSDELRRLLIQSSTPSHIPSYTPLEFRSLEDLASSFSRVEAAARAKERQSHTAAVAQLRSLERDESQGREVDAHTHADVPCTAQALPGILRYLFHDKDLSDALGLSYFPVSIIDLIGDCVHASVPREGTKGFKFCSYWKPAILRDLNTKSAAPAEGVEDKPVEDTSIPEDTPPTKLFQEQFPFIAKYKREEDTLHDINAIGTWDSTLATSSTSLERLNYALFAEKNVDELRLEDYAALQATNGLIQQQPEELVDELGVTLPADPPVWLAQPIQNSVTSEPEPSFPEPHYENRLIFPAPVCAATEHMLESWPDFYNAQTPNDIAYTIELNPRPSDSSAASSSSSFGIGITPTTTQESSSYIDAWMGFQQQSNRPGCKLAAAMLRARWMKEQKKWILHAGLINDSDWLNSQLSPVMAEGLEKKLVEVPWPNGFVASTVVTPAGGEIHPSKILLTARCALVPPERWNSPKNDAITFGINGVPLTTSPILISRLNSAFFSRGRLRISHGFQYTVARPDARSRRWPQRLMPLSFDDAQHMLVVHRNKVNSVRDGDGGLAPSIASTPATLLTQHGTPTEVAPPPMPPPLELWKNMNAAFPTPSNVPRRFLATIRAVKAGKLKPSDLKTHLTRLFPGPGHSKLLESALHLLPTTDGSPLLEDFDFARFSCESYEDDEEDEYNPDEGNHLEPGGDGGGEEEKQHVATESKEEEKPSSTITTQFPLVG